MKAAILNDVEYVRMVQVVKPKPSATEILIKVKACSICTTDVKIYHYGHKLMVFPRIIGHEVSGEIVEIGNSVQGYKTGDRVAVAPAIPCGKCYYCRRGIQNMCLNLTAIGYHYDGGFAEYMLIPEDAVKNGCVNQIPSELSFEEAALAEPLACVINGQELSHIGLDDIVVVIGAGPMGCIHLQLAKIRGAKKIVLVEVCEERIEFARAFACLELVINSSHEDSIERIKEETEGRGADRVIVACANRKAQQDSLRMVSPRGIINFFGGLPQNRSFIEFDSNLVHYNEFYVVGTHGSTPYHNKLALELISQGKVKVKELITHRLPLEKLEEGFKIMQSLEAMKILVYPYTK